MNFAEYRDLCLSLKATEETYPFGPEAAWFKVGGKAFAWTFVEPFTMDGEQKPPFTFVNMKCDPERIEALREAHAAIQPGWHQNKKFWNSVYMDGTLSPDLIRELTQHSYEIVLGSLTKKLQKEISDGS